MVERFNTLASPSTAEYKEKGSKFLAFAFPVEGEEEVKERLEELRKKYYDARHHCYAYILNPAADQFRANDDGEPSHSAGDPILGQLRSYELTNTLVVVIRYFGGTKLGVGGLVHAYKTATSDALNAAVVITKDVCIDFLLVYSYECTNDVMRMTNELGIVVKKQNFEERCELLGSIGINKRAPLIEKVKLLQDLRNNISIDFF